MAKKAAVKKEAPKVDLLKSVVADDDDFAVTTLNKSDPIDDDPFSSGSEGAVVPKRVEPDDDLLNGNEDADDFGQSFLEKDKEISGKDFEDVAKDEGLEHFNNLSESVGKNTIPKEIVTKLEDVKEENRKLKQELETLKSKVPGISDQFDQLYSSIKGSRATEILMAVQKDYLDLKYNSYTDKEKEEIRLILKDALRERFEGKVRAAKLIHKADQKGKS
jgi:hypothetical protein